MQSFMESAKIMNPDRSTANPVGVFFVLKKT